MRILVVGAGGTGGYFGGRLLQGGRATTFLVRERRAQQLAHRGLTIRSRFGDITIPNPPTVRASELDSHYDLVLLSCKAYDLEAAIASFAPAVGEQTLIMPLLNGMQHLDILDRRFGRDRVLGGLCVISVGLGEDGEILHYNDLHSVSCGPRADCQEAMREAVVREFSGCNFEFDWNESILQAMWDKWVFIAAGAGITCLMRATIGDIVETGSDNYGLEILKECAAIAAQQGFGSAPSVLERMKQTFTLRGSPFTASMLRDIERGARTEADHILGDLLARKRDESAPILQLAHAHLRAYEARRQREHRQST